MPHHRPPAERPLSVTPIFLAFAAAYFFAALVRSAMATLSPTLAAEFALSARELGLLGGSFFLAFSAAQLPLGHCLDRFGPRKVLLAFLALAVLGLIGFAQARSLAALTLARALCGVGLAACLMAPLTAYRQWFERPVQMRLGSWMLVASSLGAMASTLPVQWAVASVGWRVLFVLLAAALALSMVGVALIVPRGPAPAPASAPAGAGGQPSGRMGYADVLRHAYFRRMAPAGFLAFGGMSAMLTLWAGPWLVQVGGATPAQASLGLLFINTVMLLAYWGWGVAGLRLARRGVDMDRVMRRAYPVCLPPLAALCLWAEAGVAASTVLLTLYMAGGSVLSLSTAAMGQRFPAALAGRAMSAYNLVIFFGIFAVQWSFGLLVDLLGTLGAEVSVSFRSTLALFMAANMAAWGWMVYASRRHPDA